MVRHRKGGNSNKGRKSRKWGKNVPPGKGK